MTNQPLSNDSLTDEFEELEEAEVEEVIEALEVLADNVNSESLRAILEDAASEIYVLFHGDEPDSLAA